MSNNVLLLENDINDLVPLNINFGKYIIDKLQKFKDIVILENYDTQETTTCEELLQQSIHIAITLKNLGVKKGDVVALGHEKCNSIIPILLGVVCTGAIFTPYSLESGRSALKHKMALVRPKYLICSKSFWNLFCDLLESLEYIKKFITIDSEWEVENIPKFVKIAPSFEHIEVNLFEPVNVAGEIDTAMILYSSGTTGMPKGVRISHLNCICCTLPYWLYNSLQILFVTGAWYFSSDIFATIRYFSIGIKVVYINEVTVSKILECIQHFKVSIAMVVPSMVIRLAKADLEKYDLSSLKIIHSRGSPLHLKTILDMKQRLPTLEHVTQSYGLTECTELSSDVWTDRGIKSGSVGKVSIGVTVKIVCPKTNKIQAPNQHGEIRVKGPRLMQGYLGIPIEHCFDEERFLKTGDMGYYDEDGYIFIIDRIKDMIVYQGDKIAPVELESILQLHPGIFDAAVVGVPDPIDEELPAAFIVKQHNYDITAEEIKEYLKREIPPYMQLHGGVKFIKEIPRNSMNKILRQQLRAILSK